MIKKSKKLISIALSLTLITSNFMFFESFANQSNQNLKKEANNFIGLNPIINPVFPIDGFPVIKTERKKAKGKLEDLLGKKLALNKEFDGAYAIITQKDGKTILSLYPSYHANLDFSTSTIFITAANNKIDLEYFKAVAEPMHAYFEDNVHGKIMGWGNNSKNIILSFEKAAEYKSHPISSIKVINKDIISGLKLQFPLNTEIKTTLVPNIAGLFEDFEGEFRFNNYPDTSRTKTFKRMFHRANVKGLDLSKFSFDMAEDLTDFLSYAKNLELMKTVLGTRVNTLDNINLKNAKSVERMLSNITLKDTDVLDLSKVNTENIENFSEFLRSSKIKNIILDNLSFKSAKKADYMFYDLDTDLLDFSKTKQNSANFTTSNFVSPTNNPKYKNFVNFENIHSLFKTKIANSTGEIKNLFNLDKMGNKSIVMLNTKKGNKKLIFTNALTDATKELSVEFDNYADKTIKLNDKNNFAFETTKNHKYSFLSSHYNTLELIKKQINEQEIQTSLKSDKIIFEKENENRTFDYEIKDKDKTETKLSPRKLYFDLKNNKLKIETTDNKINLTSGNEPFQEELELYTVSNIVHKKSPKKIRLAKYPEDFELNIGSLAKPVTAKYSKSKNTIEITGDGLIDTTKWVELAQKFDKELFTATKNAWFYTDVNISIVSDKVVPNSLIANDFGFFEALAGEIKVPKNFNLKQVTSLKNLFKDTVKKLPDLSELNTGSVESFENMFRGAKGDNIINLYNWDLSKGTKAKNILNGLENFEKIIIKPSIDTTVNLKSSDKFIYQELDSSLKVLNSNDLTDGTKLTKDKTYVLSKENTTYPYVLAKSIEIDLPSEITLGSVHDAKITFNPENTDIKNFTISSSDESVLKIEKNQIKALKKGTATLTAKSLSGNLSIKKTIKVVDSVGSFTISKKPTKTQYTIGDKLDLAGTKLELKIGSSTTKITLFDFASNNIETNIKNKDAIMKSGKIKLIFTHKPSNKTAELELDVKDKVETLDVIVPDKKEYTVKDKLDLTGLSIRRNLMSKETELIPFHKFSSEKISISHENGSILSNASDKFTITITDKKYNEIKTSFDIKVSGKYKEVTLIKPKKLVYNLNEKLDLSDLQLKAIRYSDGKAEFIKIADNQFTYDDKKHDSILDKEGKFTIKFLFNENNQTFEFDIIVQKKIKNITFSNKGKTNYKVGDKIDYSELKLNFEYTDGTNTQKSYNDIKSVFTFEPKENTVLKETDKKVTIRNLASTFKLEYDISVTKEDQGSTPTPQPNNPAPAPAPAPQPQKPAGKPAAKPADKKDTKKKEDKKEKSSEFIDVKVTDWFAKYVKYVSDKKIMLGTSKDKFSPELNTNRAMIVTILHRLEKTPEPNKTNAFTDVLSNKWYNKATNWASESKIVNGYPGNLFKPMGLLTREQLVTVLFNYSKFKKTNLNLNQNALSPYQDKDSISKYALEPMKWAISQKLISGVSKTKIAPQNPATRAQLAAILMRYLENFKK